MIQLIKNGDKFSSYRHKTFQLSSIDDVYELPNLKDCAIGSEAYLITDNGIRLYVLGENNIWNKFGSTDGGSSGGSSPENLPNHDTSIGEDFEGICFLYDRESVDNDVIKIKFELNKVSDNLRAQVCSINFGGETTVLKELTFLSLEKVKLLSTSLPQSNSRWALLKVFTTNSDTHIVNVKMVLNKEDIIADSFVEKYGNLPYLEQITIASSENSSEIELVEVIKPKFEVMEKYSNIYYFVRPVNLATWQGVQEIVRAGLGEQYFPIGYQFTVPHATYGDLVFDVVAHDYLKSVHDENAHTMTIQQHDLLPGTQFDASEAFYYAEAELPAGTYNFTLATAYSSWAEGTYQFTLTRPVPNGGQLAISGYADAAMTARRVRSYANQTTTTATESVAITTGSGGTNLGTFGEGLNHSHRVSYGSNNYKESAMRQFLNSSAAAGSVWTPQTKFDRPPSWLTSLAGYKNGLDQDFLAVVGKVVLPCSANNTYEAPDSTVTKGQAYTLNDEFYLASAREIFNTSDDIDDGSAQFPFYQGATDVDRIKLSSGSAANWWMRTHYRDSAYGVRSVLPSGALSASGAAGNIGVVPACTIV